MKRLERYEKYYGPRLLDRYSSPKGWEYKSYSNGSRPLTVDTVIFTDIVDHQFRSLLER